MTVSTIVGLIREVDWEGIPLSSDWMDEITRAIQSPPSSFVNAACFHLISNTMQTEWDVHYEGEEYRLLCPDLETQE